MQQAGIKKKERSCKKNEKGIHHGKDVEGISALGKEHLCKLQKEHDGRRNGDHRRARDVLEL